MQQQPIIYFTAALQYLSLADIWPDTTCLCKFTILRNFCQKKSIVSNSSLHSPQALVLVTATVIQRISKYCTNWNRNMQAS